MALIRELETRARKSPSLPFVLQAGKTLTYAETWEAARRAAGRIAALGVQPGDRVVVVLPNSVEYCVLLYGIFLSGAAAVLVNPRWTAYEIENAIKLTRPSLVVNEQNLSSIVNGAERPIATREPPTGVSLMLLTSGTTGKPKAVMLSQDAIATNARQMVERKRITEKDRFLCSIPLFHSNGQVAALASILMGGASMAILDRFTPESMLEAVKTFETTAISGVPTLYQHLVNHYKKSPFDLSKLRICVCGSAPLPLSLFEEVEKLFGAFILEGYGLTECSAGATGNPLQKRKPGTVGTALPGTELKIMEGEVFIRGPQLMKGYFEDEAATKAALTDDGWLRTGDLGSLDDEGYLTILSRKKELIIRGGFNIYPAEVESVLREIDGVLDVTVVGLPDALQGEVVHAALISDLEQVELAERIKRHSAEKLARYKRPTSFSTHRDFPRTGSAKVQKHSLAEELKGRPELVRPLA
jgi:long-chain acyl-CoA synthetase